MDNQLRFIGVVRSEIKDRKQMPAFGAPASIELDAKYADGLLRIGKHSHIWVFAWLMGRPERDVLQVVPRGVDPDSPSPLHGVFSVRSPARPNPIGLTAARLLRVDGLRLDVDRLDFLDGTPILDIKPYFVARDMIYSARSHSIGRPRDREALRESLLFQVRNFTGSEHPDVALGIRVMEHYRAEVAQWIEPSDYDVVLPLSRPHFADAIIAITRVRLTAGLRFADCVSINGAEYRLTDAIPSFDEALITLDKQLFDYTGPDRTDSRE